MGLFSPYVYKTKKGKNFWLHTRERGKAKIYYFSQDPTGALNSLPNGYEVVENTKTGLPFLKKKKGGFFSIFKSKEGKVELNKQQAD